MNIGQFVNLSLEVPIPTFAWRPRFRYEYSSVSGFITEFVEVDGTQFVILDNKQAVNLDYILEYNHEDGKTLPSSF